MLDYLQKAKQYLWIFVEIGFLTVVSVILIYSGRRLEFSSQVWPITC